MGLYKYDDINQFLCNIKLPAFKESWLVGDCLDLKLLQCAQCTKIFWRKISCNMVKPRTKVLVPQSPLKNQCHKHTGFNKKICTNLFPTSMPQSHIIFKKQGMEEVANGRCTETKCVDKRIILKLDLRYLYHWLLCWKTSVKTVIDQWGGGHAQPTHILEQAINLKYGASAPSLAYEKWHTWELQPTQCDSFTNADVITCVPHTMSMKWTQNIQHAACLMHYKDTWS